MYPTDKITLSPTPSFEGIGSNFVKDRSAGPVLRDISMTSLQNVRPGYARKNWLVHPSNSLIRSKIEEYVKCQIATKLLFYFHFTTIHSNTN